MPDNRCATCQESPCECHEIEQALTWRRGDDEIIRRPKGYEEALRNEEEEGAGYFAWLKDQEYREWAETPGV